MASQIEGYLLMQAYLLDWANLLLRWTHVIVAIAWIGSSFYFIFLDSNLLKPTDEGLKAKGVDGALWSVHGGGFYHMQKYMVAPADGIDSKLHWFYWESYTTFLSGFALFTVLYLFNADVFLVDKQVFAWSSPWAASLTAVGLLAAYWLVYDGICRVFGFRDGLVATLILVVTIASVWLTCHLFSGRAAFLISGAMLGTTMSANVFFWIIPGQRKVVKAMTSGEPYDAEALGIHGKRGKQRSVHNTYFTLPVIIAMLSNHYSFVYNHPHHWLVFLGLMLAGTLIRQYFVLRHAYHLGKASYPWPYAAAGVALIIGLIVWLKPAPTAPVAADATAAPVGYAELKPVIESRCYICHGAEVQQNGLRFDSEESVNEHATLIYQQVVSNRNMPLANATQMTDDERNLVARWYQGRK